MTLTIRMASSLAHQMNADKLHLGANEDGEISVLIKDSAGQIELGGRIADKSGEIFSKIVDSINLVSDINNEIASASQEQAHGIEQINKAMIQLDQASQSNAASAEEIAGSTQEISSLAAKSKELTEDLNNLVQGGETSQKSLRSLSHELHSPESKIKSFNLHKTSFGANQNRTQNKEPYSIVDRADGF